MGLYEFVWELQDIESSTSNLEKRHANLLGLYVVIGVGINTSLLKYY
jgi:hypothetical protein